LFLGLVLVGCNKHEAVGKVENVSKLQTKAKHGIQYYVNQKHFNIYSENHATQKLAFLTFDDAPRRTDVDEKILNTLDKYHAKAIWFVNGNFFADEKGILKSRANMIREIKRRGHLLAIILFLIKICSVLVLN
jgi:peptidoglycan/xylan/chitin deacetylase (PgdA/CDA1 family)